MDKKQFILLWFCAISQFVYSQNNKCIVNDSTGLFYENDTLCDGLKSYRDSVLKIMQVSIYDKGKLKHTYEYDSIMKLYHMILVDSQSITENFWNNGVLVRNQTKIFKDKKTIKEIIVNWSALDATNNSAFYYSSFIETTENSIKEIFYYPNNTIMSTFFCDLEKDHNCTRYDYDSSGKLEKKSAYRPVKFLKEKKNDERTADQKIYLYGPVLEYGGGKLIKKTIIKNQRIVKQIKYIHKRGHFVKKVIITN